MANKQKTFVAVIILCVAITILEIVYLFSFKKDTLPSTVALIQRYTGFSVHKGTKNSTKRIVLWNTFFRKDAWYLRFPKGGREKDLICSSGNKCVLSINRTKPLSYDAVVFHARDNHVAPGERRPQQIYIMYVWESPTYRSNDFIRGGSFYNWTSTYSTKSDITMKHSSVFRLPVPAPDALKKLPQIRRKRKAGEAMVAWIVSHCGGASARFKYVTELKTYLKVDIYGRCGKQCPGGTGGNSIACFEKIGSIGQYKFYLAFENSICQDYISLKPYRAINSSMLPVVLGGTHTNDYIMALPPNSFIDVRNFTSPKMLADYLTHLDGNDLEYLAYHAWRKDYWVHPESGPTFCQICDALSNSTMVTPRNVDWGEFWNQGTMCDNGLVSRLLGK